MTDLQALLMIIICAVASFPCLLYPVLLTSRQLSAHRSTKLVHHFICTTLCFLQRDKCNTTLGFVCLIIVIYKFVKCTVLYYSVRRSNHKVLETNNGRVNKESVNGCCRTHDRRRPSAIHPTSPLANKRLFCAIDWSTPALRARKDWKKPFPNLRTRYVI